jgi:membrane protease YdiL (CAAX protease family)
VNRYSSRQLIVAKCALVALVALIMGPALADHPGEIPITILVVLALIGASLGAYEALSHGLAGVLARYWQEPPKLPEERIEALGVPSSHIHHLRRRDVVTALLAYLGAQALVWTIAGVIAAARVGRGDQSDLLHALAGLVPVALPGSLVAGGIALVLVLRRWKERLGSGALSNLLGLSWGRPRQIVNSILGGAALALLILPLMSIVARKPGPPDIMTQLAGSSNATLEAWMISAVLLAPPIEELMFRGALLGGIASTWNVRAGALVSGTTFWLMHGPEFVHWPAALAIGLLTILATGLRVRSRSLGPSIAAHFGYNLVLATVVATAMFTKADQSRWARYHQLHEIERIQGSAVLAQSEAPGVIRPGWLMRE